MTLYSLTWVDQRSYKFCVFHQLQETFSPTTIKPEPRTGKDSLSRLGMLWHDTLMITSVPLSYEEKV